MVIAPDRGSVTFLEVESTLDPVSLMQATRVFRTTWQLARGVADGEVTVRIAAVTRQGPLVEVHTPGLLLAGPPASVEVRSVSPRLCPGSGRSDGSPAQGPASISRAVAGRAQGTFAGGGDAGRGASERAGCGDGRRSPRLYTSLPAAPGA